MFDTHGLQEIMLVQSMVTANKKAVSAREATHGLKPTATLLYTDVACRFEGTLLPWSVKNRFLTMRMCIITCIFRLKFLSNKHNAIKV